MSPSPMRCESIGTGLASASRRQDHTTSPSACHALVWRITGVHRIPHPTFVTIAKRPSWRAQDARTDAGDLPDVTSENACGRLARRANQSAPPKKCVKSRATAMPPSLRGASEASELRCAIAHLFSVRWVCAYGHLRCAIARLTIDRRGAGLILEIFCRGHG